MTTSKSLTTIKIEKIKKPKKSELKDLLDDFKREISDLNEDWDGEGAKKIIEETFKKVVNFLVDLNQKCRKARLGSIILPQIFPGTAGEIELQWNTDRFKLVVIIPENEKATAIYYATDYADGKIKGTLELEKLYQIYITCLRMF
ncbi:MAG TPA: hypothetical protein VKK79_11235 [Candidatus Lokiarchaeia archaeon]|nr:hypothetical protein [Candidatus Lokiarchaeia archaeon]